MSKWEETFKSHTIHVVLEKLINLTNDILNELEVDENAAPEALEGILRLLQIYEIVKLKLKTVEPNLVHLVHIDNIIPLINNQNNQLDAFRTDKNIGSYQYGK